MSSKNHKKTTKVHTDISNTDYNLDKELVEKLGKAAAKSKKPVSKLSHETLNTDGLQKDK